jgi:hypothetical protein
VSSSPPHPVDTMSMALSAATITRTAWFTTPERTGTPNDDVDYARPS